MKPIVVVGAGGHGKVVADAALASGHEVLGFVDDARAAGEVVLEGGNARLVVLGDLEWLLGRPPIAVVIGIGNNPVRERLASSCLAAGHILPVVTHPTAVVSRFATIGAGTVVMAMAAVNPATRLGRGCIVNTGAVIEHDCSVGDFSHVSPNATLSGGASVGNVSHIGSGATLLPLVSVGSNTTVGAGAVVHRPVGDGVVVAGVPARKLRPSS